MTLKGRSDSFPLISLCFSPSVPPYPSSSPVFSAVYPVRHAIIFTKMNSFKRNEIDSRYGGGKGKGRGKGERGEGKEGRRRGRGEGRDSERGEG